MESNFESGQPFWSAVTSHRFRAEPDCNPKGREVGAVQITALPKKSAAVADLPTEL